MPVPQGTEVYNADAAPITARGYQYTQADLNVAREGAVQALLGDEEGHRDLVDFCSGLGLTGFAQDILEETLTPLDEEDHSKGWREGEALAEAWLIEHKVCEFPWPLNRDRRHHRASLPGAEMVGMAGGDATDCVLAFGQVKTSKQDRHPPSVVNSGAKCLISQMRDLREDQNIKKTVVTYLAHRALAGGAWVQKFRAALTRYCESGRLQMAIFGVLVRDVAADALDLSAAAAALAPDCHALTRMELVALYLPAGSIPAGPQHGPRTRRRNQQ